jgi:flagellar basal body-associated protein FliL
MILNKKLEEKTEEARKGAKTIIILILLVLIMIGTILYLQYQLINITKKCNTFWNQEIKSRCPIISQNNFPQWRGINATM